MAPNPLATLYTVRMYCASIRSLQLPRYQREAEDILRAVKLFADNYPPGYIYHAMNIQRYYDKQAPTIVVALNEREAIF